MRLNGRRRRRRPGSKPCFVLQDEAADSDHYDLRLEIDGVLASWAIPKDRRMARRVDDHPLEYAANDVVVLDRGTYANVTNHDMAECLERGHLSFRLLGERLRSRFTLTQIREGNEETWLLIRRKDTDPDAPHERSRRTARWTTPGWRRMRRPPDRAGCTW